MHGLFVLLQQLYCIDLKTCIYLFLFCFFFLHVHRASRRLLVWSPAWERIRCVLECPRMILSPSSSTVRRVSTNEVNIFLMFAILICLHCCNRRSIFLVYFDRQTRIGRVILYFSILIFVKMEKFYQSFCLMTKSMRDLGRILQGAW